MVQRLSPSQPVIRNRARASNTNYANYVRDWVACRWHGQRMAVRSTNSGHGQLQDAAGCGLCRWRKCVSGHQFRGNRGNIITDSTLYQFCVVYHANECRTGSTAGQAYLSAPFVGGAYTFALGQCVTDNVGFNFPCPIMLAANAAEIIQARGDVADPQAINWRRAGMGFMGPGRQYQFSSMIPEPTGKWGITGVNWGSGIRNDLMIAQLPGLPAGQKMTTPGNDYEPITVTLGGSTLYDQASIRFGYAENGATGSYYCMSRQEACRAGTNIQPFAYDVSDAPTWNTCTSGCTITIPAIPGRVVYYIVDRRNSSTSATKSASPAVLAVP